MSTIVIRRWRLEPKRSVEAAVALDEGPAAALTLRDLFLGLQRERGVGAWSEADPEILVGGSFAARLRVHEEIVELVGHVLRELRQWTALRPA